MMNKSESAQPNGAPKAACCSGHSHAGHDHSSHDHHPHAAETVRDPVCGMTVNPTTSKHRFDYRGETFHFCSASCRTKFAADPVAYFEKDSMPKRRFLSETVASTLAKTPFWLLPGPGALILEKLFNRLAF